MELNLDLIEIIDSVKIYDLWVFGLVGEWMGRVMLNH